MSPSAIFPFNLEIHIDHQESPIIHTALNLELISPNAPLWRDVLGPRLQVRQEN